MHFEMALTMARCGWAGLRRMAAVAAVTTMAMAAEPALEFSGLVAGPGETKLILTSLATGQSRWVTVGQEFAGYTVTAYEQKAETVVLTKAGETFRLKMKESKIAPGVLEPPPMVQRSIMNNLRQLAAAADQFYIETGRVSVSFDELVGPKKYVKKIESLDGEDYRAIEFAQGKPLAVTTAGGFKLAFEPRKR